MLPWSKRILESKISVLGKNFFVSNACAYINEGVLSELVVFGTNLFANVAGPSEDVSTLYRVPALPGDIISNRGGWRDSSY